MRVVFIAGYARSGSTLLERLLGQIDGFESFGELRHIWFRSFEENQLCGCGRPFHDCPFWGEVVTRAYGGFDKVNAAAIGRVKHSVDAFVQIPQILSGGWSRSFRRRMASYAERLSALYRAIQAVSGATYLVDATKDPQHALILALIPGFDVRIVHLVRDSRAVVFSWRRTRRRPEIHWEHRDMPRYPGVRTVIAWSMTNLGAEAARRRLPYVRVRYEDLVRDPSRELAGILEALGLEGGDLGFVRPGSAVLAPAHTVAGNPMRFRTGAIEIRPDDEWSARMGPFHRSLITGLTRGLLTRYGYRPPSPAARTPAGPRPAEMWRTFRLAIGHRRDPLAYGRAAARLCVRYLLSRRAPIAGHSWLDVGTGVGTLPEALVSEGAEVVALDVEDRRAAGARKTGFVVARGERMPFSDDLFDGVTSSNVLEHVRDTWGLIEELLRVCRPGGLVYLSWTNWYSPFGGHEWSPLHYMGRRLGPRLYRSVLRRSPMNVPGETLFPVHVGKVIRGLRERGLVLLDVAPRYWPSLRFLARIPGLREVSMWNCVVLIRKSGAGADQEMASAGQGEGVAGSHRVRERRLLLKSPTTTAPTANARTPPDNQTANS
ncbi:MAG: sulfotransferase [Actinomycetota bacterium]